MTITMYGIKKCDTIKKARTWLEGQGIAYNFHDYKALGVDAETVRSWVDEHGWEIILNRAGTTFRGLPDADKQGINADKAVALMVANPSMIKRPVLDLGDRRLVGFKPDVYAAAFA
ncbi:MAG: ArsC family reductase [Sphingobium sp.]